MIDIFALNIIYPMKKIFLLRFAFAVCVTAFCTQNIAAQVANDDCANAILLSDVTQYCSQNAEYTNETATLGTTPPAFCFTGNCSDVWFKFVAVASDLNININGESIGLPGGTLIAPEVALYKGTCDALQPFGCKKDLIFANIIELNQTGLLVGQTYYIRVCATNGSEGTFRLCINNYNPVPPPKSDCPKAVQLCDKSGFTVQAVTGAGTDPFELDGAECFQTSFPPYETNSTWYVWTAANNGTLTFTLNPSNPADDLDFVVYELPNGPTDCANKISVRCMAAGDFTPTSPCMGPTGLDDTSTDTSNPPGCVGITDNFLAALDMTAGSTYALAVNNFTSTGNGFTISFGGTGEFASPQVAFNDSDPDDVFCTNADIVFTDATSVSQGTISSWNWNFGSGAVPATANTKGPHSVKYTTAGAKSVTLTVKSNTGCNVTLTRNFSAIVCCTAALSDSFFVQNPKCNADTNGLIIAIGKLGTPPYRYKWSTGDTTALISKLGAGTYKLTITDANGCFKLDSIKLINPAVFTVTATPDTVTIFEGTPVVLTATASESPATFVWKATNFSQTGSSVTVSPMDSTLYIVTALSSVNNCEAKDSVRVFVKLIKYFLPNAFTPDGDNLNDTFGATVTGITVSEFKIFTRWGQIVHDDPNSRWDGTRNGESLPPDVYAYRIVLKYPDGSSKPLSGGVTLVR